MSIDKKNLEQYFYKILDAVPTSIYWKNTDGAYVYCNKYMLEMAGMTSRSDIEGKYDIDLPWKDIANNLHKIDQQVIQTKCQIEVEEMPMLANAQRRIFLTSKTPLFSIHQKVIGLIGVSFDITERKQAEAREKAAEKKLRETENKLDGMMLVNDIMAHELRTPLASLSIAVDALKDVFPSIKQGYITATEKNLISNSIDSTILDRLEGKLNSMQHEIRSAFTFIDMSLIKSGSVISQLKNEVISISECIEEAILRYPFNKGQKELVQWERNSNVDFLVKGDNVLLIHVLFNLFKNSLYYIAKAGKGNIQIYLVRDSSNNKLFLKDAGTGISSEVLPHIFENFFSRTYHGAGIGLTFCKKVMESLGGDITCESIEGEYTLFILSFPRLME